MIIQRLKNFALLHDRNPTLFYFKKQVLCKYKTAIDVSYTESGMFTTIAH